MQPAPLLELIDIRLDNQDSTPLFRQLYFALRERILNGRLRAGTRLPASRALAQQLKISRNTVLSALETLQGEGYINGSQGSGTFVTDNIPDLYFKPDQQNESFNAEKQQVELSAYGQRLQDDEAKVKTNNRAFTPGVPDLEDFPRKLWQQLASRYYKSRDYNHWGFNDIKGYQPLRQAICDYLRSSRAVKCSAEQIIITTGAQQGLDLVTRLLLNPGDSAAIEDPGYVGAKRALLSAGADVHPIAIDEDGIDINLLQQLPQSPRMLCVTPTHQYPWGVIMPLSRRMNVLSWARANKAWIVEDDYDSEYHFDSRPIASLQGLDPDQRVLYIGSFSKVLYPAIRIGYLIVPEDLIDVFAAGKNYNTGESPTQTQAILADFMLQGHFSAHLKKMRLLYSQRLQLMQHLCQRQLSNICQCHAYGAGMHLTLTFNDGRDDTIAAKLLHTAGINASPLSRYFAGKVSHTGLVLGFGNADTETIQWGINTMAKVLG